MKHPYQIVQHRVDRITRLPKWCQGDTHLKVGTFVYRLDARTVQLIKADYSRGCSIRLGQSYSKFHKYV